MNFLQKISQEILLFDGAMGTMLQMSGMKSGEVPEIWNIEKPEIIKGIHASYLLAGSKAIETNSFGANELTLARHNLIDKSYELTLAAVKNARAAANESALVIVSMGSTGEVPAPAGEASFEAIYNAYLPQIKAAVDGGGDAIMLETMTDMVEARIAFLAAKENCSLPIIVSFTYEPSGRTAMGNPIEAVVAAFDTLGADVIGINCSGGPQELAELLKVARVHTNKYISVLPNAGIPQLENGKTTFPYGPEEYASYMKIILDAGANAIGGCCGTTPDHIRALTKLLQDRAQAVPHAEIPFSLVTPRGIHAINFALPAAFALSPAETDEELALDVLDYATENDLVYIDLTALPLERIPAFLYAMQQYTVSYPCIFTADNSERINLALRYYHGIAGVHATDFINDLRPYGEIFI